MVTVFHVRIFTHPTLKPKPKASRPGSFAGLTSYTKITRHWQHMYSLRPTITIDLTHRLKSNNFTNSPLEYNKCNVLKMQYENDCN